MNIQYKLTTDLMHPGVMPRIDVVQGDINTRSIELSIYEEEYLWKIPENAHVSVRYAKPDGTRGIYDTLPDGTAACICHDNVVEFALAPQMLTAAGPVLTQVVIIQGKKQLATFSIQVHVNSDPSAGVTTSEDYVNWMDAVIGSQVDRVFQEAKDSGVFNGPAGPAGKTPKIEAARFNENLRTGVKLTVTNPGEGNQLDQVTRVQIFDGENGAPGENGKTPKIEAARFSENQRTGVKLTVTNPGEGNQLDQVTKVQIFDGENGAPGANGRSATIEANRVEDRVDLVITTPISSSSPDNTTFSVSLFDGKTPRRNWLDNSDFHFAVNQRGEKNYVVDGDAPVDAIDRWTLMSYGSEMSVDAYQAVICRGMFLQNLSKEAESGLAGKTVTVVVEDDYNRVWVASGSFSNGFSAASNGLTISVSSTALILTTDNIRLTRPRIGLYEGEYTAETLPKYQYKGYAAELMECRRYYIAPDAVSIDVETLPEGAPATSSVSGTVDNMRIALGIPQGIDGYTPQRGIDYYTEADKQEMTATVMADLADGLTLTDQTTGTNYRIYVANGKLTMEEV